MYLYLSAIREPFVLSIESSVAVVVAVARERCGGTFFRARSILFFFLWCWQRFFALFFFFGYYRRQLFHGRFGRSVSTAAKTFTKKEYETTHQCQLLSRDRRRSSSREDSSPRGRRRQLRQRRRRKRRLKEERAPRSRAPRLLLLLFLHTERRRGTSHSVPVLEQHKTTLAR